MTQTLRTAYRDIGLVVGPQMRRLFGQAPGRRPEWAVVDLVSGQCGRARDVVAEDLFGSIPPHWEVTRVETAAVRVLSYLEGIELRRG